MEPGSLRSQAHPAASRIRNCTHGPGCQRLRPWCLCPWHRQTGLDVIAVVVALHGEYTMGMVLGDFTLGRELGASVVFDLAFDHKVSGSVLFAMLPVEVAVLDFAGKLPFVGRRLPVCFARQFRDVVAVVSSGSYQRPGVKRQSANHRKPNGLPHFHDTPPSEWR